MSSTMFGLHGSKIWWEALQSLHIVLPKVCYGRVTIIMAICMTFSACMTRMTKMKKKGKKRKIGTSALQLQDSQKPRGRHPSATAGQGRMVEGCSGCIVVVQYVRAMSMWNSFAARLADGVTNARTGSGLAIHHGNRKLNLRTPLQKKICFSLGRSDCHVDMFRPHAQSRLVSFALKCWKLDVLERLWICQPKWLKHHLGAAASALIGTVSDTH